jgi:zinc protease
MYFLYHPGYTGEQVIVHAEEEVARLRDEGIGADELGRARTYLRASRIRQLQSTRVRAALLGQYELIDGNPELINTELADYLAVTADQIRDAAALYIGPDKRILLDIVPAEVAA